MWDHMVEDHVVKSEVVRDEESLHKDFIMRVVTAHMDTMRTVVREAIKSSRFKRD